MIARSLLYVPGDQPDKLAKALTRGADALILDLEDAVPVSRKSQARSAVAEFLRSADRGETQLWVRVNSGDLLAEDVADIRDAAPDGISLAKATAEELRRLDSLLKGTEIEISALVETPNALLELGSIASSPRVTRMAIGEADLAAELGMDPSEDGREWQSIRMSFVVHSAAAGLAGPIGPVSTNFTDMEELARSTHALRRMGFTARAAIHPAQLNVINETLTPTEAEIDAALRLVELFEAAQGAATTDDEGRMIDEPIVRAARALLQRRR